MRSQFLHVIDVTPTLLEVTGIEAPDVFNGIPQDPLEGASFADTFEHNGSEALAKRDTQYFAMFGNRGVYNDGWMASAFHRDPWIGTGTEPFYDDPWELFNIEEDFTQNDDLSGYFPEKLEEMQKRFEIEANKYNVYPLDDRVSERGGCQKALRPTPKTFPIRLPQT